MGSGNVSQDWTSACLDHLDYHCPQKYTTSFLHGNTSRLRKQNQHATIQDVFGDSLLRCFLSDVVLGDKFLRSSLSFCFRFESECNTSITKSQSSSAGIPPIRNPAQVE